MSSIAVRTGATWALASASSARLTDTGPPPPDRIGFRHAGAVRDDEVLYQRLRQHPWSEDVEWSGNHGGHYGGYEAGFLRAYVLPHLTS